MQSAQTTISSFKRRTWLKDELVLVHKQLHDVRLENEQMRELKDNYIRKLEEQLREKQKEISKLSVELKSYNPEEIKESVWEKATNHYEGKIKELHSEADSVRKQFVQLRCQHASLKCKFESCESEYTHKIERLKVQHLGEIEILQSKIKSLENEKSSPDDNTAIELKSAKHEILQLNSKIRGLLAECEELRAQNENLSLQLQNVNRTHLNQAADYMSNIRSLESEKQRVIWQKEVLEKELSNVQEQRRILNNDVQASKQEVLSLKSNLEEYEHKYQKINTDLQLENKRLQTDFQSEKEQLIDEITRLKLELKDVTGQLDHTQQILMAKEQEFQQNSMLAQQQLWKQSNEFQLEKEKIERKFQNFKNEKDQLISQLSQDLQILQQNLQMCAESKLELEKELHSMKEKFEENAKGTDVVTTVSKQNLDYEKEIQRLQDQIDQLNSNRNAYLQEKDRILSDILSRHEEKSYDEDREILQLKLSWEQQKHEFHIRLEDLESQLKETKNSSAAEKKELELKIQRYSRAVNKLKEKLEFQKVKNEDLETQKEVLEKNVPYETYLQVRNKLTELQRKLEEYRLIVAAEPHFSVSTRASGPPVSDKLLTDIKNLQIRLPSTVDVEYDVLKLGRQKTQTVHSKKSHTRRKSLRKRITDQSSRTVSPVITSSSDLDLENL